jgi:ribonucleoside-diphosphate reductase beta chain
MLGNAGIIKLINRDENLHVAITQDLIKILRENKTEGFIDTIKEAEDKAVALFRAAVDEEKDWADYLFSRGPLLGLNSQILHGYIEWLANKRMESIGLPQIYNAPSNPIGGWLSNWVDSQKVQAAAQETTLLSYKVKSSISDLQNVDLGSI